MFSALTKNLSKIFDKLRGKAYISDKDIDVAMRDIKMALLDADVSLAAIDHLVHQIKQHAVGTEVVKSTTPGQTIVKIMHDEMHALLQAPNHQLSLATTPPAVLMMVGLQGSGKTTSSAKLAYHLQHKHGKKVLLASLDIYRPAAQLQLQKVAEKAEVDCLPIVDGQLVLEITQRALGQAQNGYDVLILDTAGRMHTNEQMMEELRQIASLANPLETILVLDALTGQDAVNIGKKFSAALPITAAILTKVDSDARGGAALSLRHITGIPIKFVGLGESIAEFDSFDAKRIASRILGMGDVVALVEKAEQVIKKEDAERVAKNFIDGELNFDDMLTQIQAIKKMGSISSIISMLPGAGKISDMITPEAGQQAMGNLKKQEAAIYSMNKHERRNPKLINGSRKLRIAKGAGISVFDVNQLLKAMANMRDMQKKMTKGGKNNIKMQEMMRDFTQQ